MKHICVAYLTVIASDNGLSSSRRQTIIWTNTGILLIGPLGINFSEILIEIHTFSFKKMYLKMSSAKRRPFCLGLNVLTHWGRLAHKIWISESVNKVDNSSGNGFVACLAPGNYLNECWLIVNWAFRDKFTWYSNQNKAIFIHGNEFENVVCRMTAILSQLECVLTKLQYEYTTGVLLVGSLQNYEAGKFKMKIEWKLFDFFTEVCSGEFNWK